MLARTPSTLHHRTFRTLDYENSFLLPFLYSTKTITRGFSNTKTSKHPPLRKFPTSPPPTLKRLSQDFTVNEPWEEKWKPGEKVTLGREVPQREENIPRGRVIEDEVDLNGVDPKPSDDNGDAATHRSADVKCGLCRQYGKKCWWPTEDAQKCYHCLTRKLRCRPETQEDREIREGYDAQLRLRRKDSDKAPLIPGSLKVSEEDEWIGGRRRRHSASRRPDRSSAEYDVENVLQRSPKQELTRLIQQSNNNNRPTPSSTQANPPQKKSEPYIPFERPKDPYADLEGTTITPAEKNAFESLFKLKSPPAQQDQDGQTEKSDTLDSILSTARATIHQQNRDPSEVNALPTDTPSRTPKARRRLQSRPPPQMPAPLKALQEASAASLKDEINTSLPRKSSKQRMFDLAVGREIAEVKRALERTETDVEVWERVLRGERVLGAVGALGLGSGVVKTQDVSESLGREEEGRETAADRDEGGTTELTLAEPPSSSPPRSPTTNPENTDLENAAVPTQPATSKKLTTPPSPTPLQLLTATLPTHILTIFSFLTTHYPSSPLSLQILPLLCHLCPQARTLCLSTELYNAHLRQLYTTFGSSSLAEIIGVLEEMDKEVYMPDQGTSRVLDSVLRDTREKFRGSHGGTVAGVLRMRGAREGVGELRGWRGMIQERLEGEAVRKTRDRGDKERDGRWGDVREVAGNEVY